MACDYVGTHRDANARPDRGVDRACPTYPRALPFLFRAHFASPAIRDAPRMA